MITWLIVRYRRYRHRRDIAMFSVFLMLAFCVLGNSFTFLYFDGPGNPELTFGDALWYSVISITTIGYGDLSSSSAGARLGTFFFIVLLGLSTFTVFFGMLIDWVTEVAVRGQLGMSTIHTKDHIVVVNYPSTTRVRQLLDELSSDPEHGGREFIIVADEIEKLPFSMNRVSFVRGSPLQLETYQRACLHNAKMALVLATSYSDGTSDAVVASAVSVINQLNADIHIVAECLDEKHRTLFESVDCDAVVPGMRIIGNLLAQEIHDPGVARMVDVITSNLEGDTLFTTQVGDQMEGADYRDFAKRLLDSDINLMCVNRGQDSHTHYGGMRPTVGDILIYVATRRMSWSELRAMGG